MYLYSFDTFAGHDKVFRLIDDSFFYKSGDLILDGERVFCVLGPDVAFQEQYTMVYKPYHPRKVLEKGFFSVHQLALLHFIVSTYYSTYKAVIKLLLPSTEIVPLLSYKVKNKKSHYSPVVFDEKTSLFVPSELKQEGQQLILIPDLWTGYNMFDDTVLDQSTIRYSGLTALQMTKIFRGTKQGQIGTLMTTFAGIFHDWKNLQRILFVQPDKRYYQHQQDPRYKVAAVVDFIAEKTGAEVVKWG